MPDPTSSPLRSIPLAKPWFDHREQEEVAKVLARGWVTQGPAGEEFERQIATRFGAGYAAATSSCTTALHLALKVAGIGPGDEVAVPSFTFIAPVNAIVQAGAEPVFVDVEPNTYNLDPWDLARALTKKVKAVIVVHQFGLAADLDSVHSITRGMNLTLIEDAACALGSLRDGKPVGQHGLLTAVSFHPRKIITTGEGGMLVSPFEGPIVTAKQLRNHGASLSASEREKMKGLPVESYGVPGFNYRMSDLQAAVGLAQVEKLDEIIRRRRELAALYIEVLAVVPYTTPPVEQEGFFHTYQTYCAVLDPKAPLSRDELVLELRRRGIGSNRGCMAVHREPAYQVYATRELPATEDLADRSFLLPLHPHMTAEDVRYVASALEEILGKR